MSTIFLIIIAITPGIAVATFIYFKDDREPEPVNLLLLSFLYGTLAFSIAYVLTTQFNRIITLDEKNLKEQAVQAFLLVAFIEEASKFIFVRGFLYRNKNFNEPLDGIVYSVMVGMGFATAENVIYVLSGGGSGGTGLLRMFTAIPSHAMFAVLMGYYLGKAKFTRRKETGYAVIALVVATAFHGVYDYFLFVSFVPGIGVLAFVSLLIAFFLSRKAIHLHQLASPFTSGPSPKNKADSNV
jgi:RsiW-degrading membrane proteinase PrsW (M82 family)